MKPDTQAPATPSTSPGAPSPRASSFVDGDEPVGHASAPMWAAAGLLALELVALALLLGARLEASGVWSQAVPRDLEALLARAVQALTRSGDALVVVVGLIPAAVMAGVAAPLMIVARRVGWLLAMLAQALLLMGCLARYAADGGAAPRFIFPLLAYAVMTVLYLNARHVRAAVYDRPAEPIPSEEAEMDGPPRGNEER